MKQKLLSLFLFLTINAISFAQVANQPNDYVVCDDDNDGFALFDLTNPDAQVLGSQSAEDYTITYHETQSDAINGINALYYLYVNNTNWLHILYVRLEDNSTGSYDTAELSLVVINTSEFTAEIISNDVFFSDTDSDPETPVEANLCGFGSVTIETNSPLADGFIWYRNGFEMFGETSSSLVVTQSDVYQVAAFYNQCGSVAFSQLVVLNLYEEGTVIDPQTIMACDNSSADGTAVFNLDDLSASLGLGDEFVISYYTSTTDANQAINSIVSPYNSAGETLIVRVEDIDAAADGFLGCRSLSTVDLVVNPLPYLDFESDYSFCLGDTLVLDTELSASEYAFQWAYNGNLIPGETQSSITVTQPGFYNVTVIALSGCGSVTTMINVEEVICTDTDEDGVIDSDEDLNDNDDLEDDDTDDDGIPNYLDSDDDGDNVATIDEINIVLGRSNNTIHQFVDTDGDEIENYLDSDDDGDGVLTIDEDYNDNGDPTDDDTNSNTIPDYLESSVALSINEFNVTSFSMFPNPAKENVTIQLASSNFGTGNVNIFNIQGKAILKHIKFEGNSSIIDISSLESGFYFVELTVGNTATIQKLIVN